MKLAPGDLVAIALFLGWCAILIGYGATEDFSRFKPEDSLNIEQDD